MIATNAIPRPGVERSGFLDLQGLDAEATRPAHRAVCVTKLFRLLLWPTYCMTGAFFQPPVPGADGEASAEHARLASELADTARQAAYPSYTNPPTPSEPGAPVDDNKSLLCNSCPPRSAPRRAFIDALKQAAQPPFRHAAPAASSSHDTQPPMVANRRGLPGSSQRAMIPANASKPHGFTAAMLRLIGR